MSSFQTNPTVAAKDLIRSGNPESMNLDELKELKKKCEAILSQLRNLCSSKNHTSANEKLNILARRKEMELFIGRILDLINSFQSLPVEESEAAGSEIENLPPIRLPKIRM
jgi:hypothetical protein